MYYFNIFHLFIEAEELLFYLSVFLGTLLLTHYSFGLIKIELTNQVSLLNHLVAQSENLLVSHLLIVFNHKVCVCVHKLATSKIT